MGQGRRGFRGALEIVVKYSAHLVRKIRFNSFLMPGFASGSPTVGRTQVEPSPKASPPLTYDKRYFGFKCFIFRSFWVGTRPR